jgi:hypothetical protein
MDETFFFLSLTTSDALFYNMHLLTRTTVSYPLLLLFTISLFKYYFILYLQIENIFFN